MGLANDKSLAWGIAKALRAQGAEMAFSYQGEALEKRVRPLAAELGSDFLIPCDVADMAGLDATFAALEARWGTIDFVVHAIGFSDKNELRGKYADTSLDNFLMTMNVSVYSFVAVATQSLAIIALTLTLIASMFSRSMGHDMPKFVNRASPNGSPQQIEKHLFQLSPTWLLPIK